jgi:peptidoglycan LD-endopeptidase LytH
MKKISRSRSRLLCLVIALSLFSLSIPLPWSPALAEELPAQDPGIQYSEPPLPEEPQPLPEPPAPEPVPEPAPEPIEPPAPVPAPEPPPAAEPPVEPPPFVVQPLRPDPQALQDALAPSYTVPAPAPRAPSPELLQGRSALEEARAALQARQAELDLIAEDFHEAEEAWQLSREQLHRARIETAAARLEYQRVQAQLAERVRALYMSRTGYDAALVDAVINSDSTLNNVVDRVERVLRFLKRDQDLFDKAKEHLERLNELTAILEAKEQESAELFEAVQAAKTKAEEMLEAAKDEYEALRERVRILEEEEEARRQAEARAAGLARPLAGIRSSGLMVYTALDSQGWVFPVQGANSFINDWGFPRSGGRTHKGTDIFAPRHTPLVAVVGGVISKTSPVERGLGGITLWLRGDDGNSYYYAHLEAIAEGIVPGVRVQAGQFVGTMGDSGNARTTPTHLHFEIHPGGGPAVNPYPTLVKYRY